jgi:hypothetical protein
MATQRLRTYVDHVRRVRRLGDTPVGVLHLKAQAAGSVEATLTNTATQIFERVASWSFHPTKAADEEDLPEGYSHSYVGFLIHNHHREISVDQDVVKQEMDYLTQFVSIVCFIGGSPPMAAIPQWIKQLQNEIKSSLSFGWPLGKGFFTVKAMEQDAVRRLMLLSPFRSSAGLCIFQRWVPDFDPNADRGIHKGNRRADFGLKIPTWITLSNLQDEFRGVAHQIAAGLGEVLGASSDNSESKDPKFCVGLFSGEG